MKPTDIRYYPLPNGEFVVSYFDTLRRERIQQTFTEEWKATEASNKLKAWRPVKEQKRTLQNCSIEELMQVYLDEMPEASLNKTPQLIKDFLLQFAFHKCTQIDEISMRSFYQRQKLEYDYTSHSLATRKYQIQGFFKWMKARGLIEDSPQLKIKMGRSKVYKRPHFWVRPNEINQVIKGAKRESPGFLYPILLLANETAAKTHDIIELKWKDIDFKNKTVIFHAEDKLQQRILNISDELIEMIKSTDQISEFVFTNLEGRPLRKEILVRELRLLKRKLGIEQDWVFRDLRHSFAVNFLKGGGELKALKEILGHNHVRMTEELYGRFKTQKVDFIDS